MTIIAAPSPVPAGIIEAIEAAGYGVSQGREGEWDVSNPAAVQAVMDSYAGSAAQLEFTKKQMLDALALHYADLYKIGRNYNGKNFQLDTISLQNINGASSMAMLANQPGGTWPANFVWIASDNSTMALTANDMLAFGVDVGGYVTGLVMSNRALKDAINAAASIAELQAIDISSGWPANNG